ncbi:MAG: bifunctional phosphopantothenoylcysteine decarboxylase/phosphopantothenate--cysteine ligase CoaBC [Candidatus Thioglobus sp.]|jgi:phosphopantothenoylcysteine decarboxylase/phosphopantothenate--cysteine ligase|uniref:bifunctional phosphopantothenoylcysteine decarboxylase/phosphopantothenate--cysteine ligase CoaBC n=1 Tax=Candidatus Thioglobus sp. TaxID=2026721 RepID=UPI001D65AD0A|nr:bifunctional phosphopantothenoylcysteine decarboxylase/phosphopantothenate--cysteine ligase CoaBC [Candidatus Thioglobus sp.]MBT3186824.1 bifunctional phosphopantothenoylcysteine decarboxylase/phosphopantothenate--cysteine ligase CoaBC [Candidatus Thioglobus sp.]MBT3431096.1 bifunctional phosphopantothenoylcysteine decarboxylase/phosphopantothenate--cysteine ligase CoaBC [Candidatus Thioglobus sp.]MBT3965086.1 bifunctional phosphopantothenoylcysteine decarboxylase/phosphopantothenate--cystein
MKTLTNKRIVLGVSGSIAAYKAPDVVRRLQDLGAEVRAILTQGGAKFITELSLQATSKNKVHNNLWDNEAELSMGHIELAKWADAILIAPASANTIANLSAGKACDLLTNVVLATDAPVLIAPAMNQQMYASSAVKDNLSALLARNIKLISPEFGEQACGDVGEGRLTEPSKIAKQVSEVFSSTKLTGKKILITLGATIEPIDPVRYLSNHSSGKMGMALARASIEAGAKVTLIYGNVSIPLSEESTNILVGSGEEMHQAVMENIKDQDVFIACAAVSDYRVKNIEKNKIKKENTELTLELIPNKDILVDVCKLKQKPICIGFAAETQNLIENAQNKLKNKGCDAIILNDVSKRDFGFKNDENEVVFLTKKYSQKIEKNSKQIIGRKIIEIIVEKFL